MRARPSHLAAVLLAALLLGSAPARALPAGARCTLDEQCDVGTICTRGACTALERSRRIIPFYWHRGGEVGYRHIIPILYFSWWDRDGKAQVQVPFVFHVKRYKDASDTWVLPLFLTSWTRSPTETSVRIWPFFWYSSYRGNRRGTGAMAALLPLFWWSHVGERETVVAPLFVYHRDPIRSIAVGFPLVWHTDDREKGFTNTLVLPLFDYEKDHFGKRRRLFSLVAAWEKDDDARLEQLLLFAPPFFHRRDPLRDIDVAPPLFARWRVHDNDSTGLIAGPVYHGSDHDGSTTVVFPLYWGFRDRRTHAATHLLFPLGGVHTGPGLAGFALGPLYGWRNTNGEGSAGLGLLPLFLLHRKGTRFQQLLLPLFARYGDHATGTTTTAVGPLFARTTRDGWDAGLLPVLFFGRHAGHSYAALPPLFVHRSTPDATLDVIGPGYFYRGTRGFAAGLAPLAFFGRLDGSEHQIVFPLFFHVRDRQREALLVGPFYHRRDPAGTVDALFPLLYLRRGPTRSLLLAPLLFWKRDTQLGRQALWVGPWFSKSDQRQKSRTQVLLPLYVGHDAPDYHVRVAFPFFWSVVDHDEHDLSLFPLYYHVRSPRLSVDALFPLFLHARSPVASTTVLGPFWVRRRTDGGRSVGLPPLFLYGKSMENGRARQFAAGPGFFWSKNDLEGSANLVAGPYFDVRRPSGYTAGLIPLVFAWRRGTESQGLAPFLYWDRDPAAHRALTVLGPLYFGHDDKQRRFGLAPLLFYKSDGEGTSSTVLFPLAYFQRTPTGSRLLTPIAGYSKTATGHRFYIGPFYRRSDAAVSSTAFWPLAYFTRNHKTGQSVSMLLPFLFDNRGEDGHQLQMYSPLVWRLHSVERNLIFGLPLYFDLHNYGESRTTWFLPLIIRYDSQVSKATSYVIPPLATWWRTRRGDDPGTDAVVFPILWRFGGRDPTTVVAPFWWDFRRGESRTTVLFPLGARWTRPDGEHTIVLNTYYRKGLGPEKGGSWYFHFVPLLDFGRPRKRDLAWNFLEGLFGYSREGRTRYLRIFWLIDIPLAPQPAEGVSFFGSTSPQARTEF